MPTRPTTTRLPILFLAAAVLVLEAVAAFAFGLLEVPQIRMSRLVVGLGVTLLMLGYGVFLVLIARGVARGRRWARGPAVATQLLQGLLAWSFAAGQTQVVAVALGATAVLVLACVLSPSATAIFAPSDPGGEG